MSKTQRMTKQKKVIMDVLRSTTSHPTAEWIYTQAKKIIPDLSLGTVYRNLNLLKESNLIMELNYGSSFNRYDANPKNHYHFQCQRCGNVYDLDFPIDAINQEKIINGHHIYSHRLEFYGLCSICAKEQGKGQ